MADNLATLPCLRLRLVGRSPANCGFAWIVFGRSGLNGVVVQSVAASGTATGTSSRCPTVVARSAIPGPQRRPASAPARAPKQPTAFGQIGQTLAVAPAPAALPRASGSGSCSSSTRSRRPRRSPWATKASALTLWATPTRPMASLRTHQKIVASPSSASRVCPASRAPSFEPPRVPMTTLASAASVSRRIRTPGALPRTATSNFKRVLGSLARATVLSGGPTALLGGLVGSCRPQPS
mmetsp:Transcript_134290/g.335063  ORF Transcript_134290/g.335063 Transcript_134290/m.335063 type:complete len:238 (-) Transcript_134290:1664-2377(-)